MVLHLEAGSCESGADSYKVDDIAYDCYHAEWYITEDGADMDYECPSCDTGFYYMSGLLQHIESQVCDEKLTKGKPLRKFLNFLHTQI
jgi:hypothetical protein